MTFRLFPVHDLPVMDEDEVEPNDKLAELRLYLPAKLTISTGEIGFLGQAQSGNVTESCSV